MERLGGSLAPAVTADWFGFQCSVLSEHLGEAAALLDTVLHRPALHDDVIAHRARPAGGRRAAARRRHVPLSGPAGVPCGLRGGRVRPAGPGAARDTVPALSGGRCAAVARCHDGAGRTARRRRGDLDPERAAEQLAGVVRTRRPPRPRCAAGLGGAARRHLAARALEVETRDKAQTALAMLFPGPDRRADRPACRRRLGLDRRRPWRAAVRGPARPALPRLHRGGHAVAAPSAGAILTYIATSPAREAEAREAMLAELERFRGGTPGAGEVGTGVNYLTGQHRSEPPECGSPRRGDPRRLAAGGGAGGTGGRDGAVPSVTPARVHDVACRYLDLDGRIEGVVRGAAGRRDGSHPAPPARSAGPWPTG